MCSIASECIAHPMSHQCDCHVVGRRSNMMVTAMVDNVHRKWNPFGDIHNIPHSLLIIHHHRTISADSNVWTGTCCDDAFATKLHLLHSSPRGAVAHDQQSHCVPVHCIAHDVHGTHRMLGSLHVIRHRKCSGKRSGDLHGDGLQLAFHAIF